MPLGIVTYTDFPSGLTATWPAPGPAAMDGGASGESSPPEPTPYWKTEPPLSPTYTYGAAAAGAAHARAMSTASTTDHGPRRRVTGTAGRDC